MIILVRGPTILVTRMVPLKAKKKKKRFLRYYFSIPVSSSHFGIPPSLGLHVKKHIIPGSSYPWSSYVFWDCILPFLGLDFKITHHLSICVVKSRFGTTVLWMGPRHLHNVQPLFLHGHAFFISKGVGEMNESTIWPCAGSSWK